MAAIPAEYPELRQVALDTTDARSLAEFYRRLLGWEYRPGDEMPAEGTPDDKGRAWLVLVHPRGTQRIAFQQVDSLPRVTWPQGLVPQQLHLDLMAGSIVELERHHRRALELGAQVLRDRSDGPEEALRVYADPAGHPFCIFSPPA